MGFVKYLVEVWGYHGCECLIEFGGDEVRACCPVCLGAENGAHDLVFVEFGIEGGGFRFGELSLVHCLVDFTCVCHSLGRAGFAPK